MPQSITVAVENNFTKGLITESTGLNFPENASTDTDNCLYTLIGEVTRREGINYEVNHSLLGINKTNKAMSSYKWNNVGGDGLTQIVVQQVGASVYFYRSSTATAASPLSAQRLPTVLDLTAFVVPGGFMDEALECQFADGNGYLFIYHPSCDPVYSSYAADTAVITSNRITVKVRDFSGVKETGDVSVRPTVLSTEHNYNILNQGWISGNGWQGSDTTSSVVVGLGSKSFTIAAGLPITLGDAVTIIYNGNPAAPGAPPVGTPLMSGTVTAYSGTSLTVNVNSGSTAFFGTTMVGFLVNPRSVAYIGTWHGAVGNYPSNADVWWYFKDASGAFNPATTLANVSLSTGNAPRGHFILEAFNQQRAVVGNVTGVTPIVTTARPQTGCWFQGRVWYAGVNAQQTATGDADYYTWTENIYFSQVVNTSVDFGICYQTNDPTSENLFDLLPTDGGVIQIQGCGSVYKLFPIQNGLLVFAANGIWFITGSRGIGFSANDYTVTKISSVQSISGSTFVNVQGLPFFWNEEGIYSVSPSKDGSLTVEPITIGTILDFYNSIPHKCKRYARGDYHPIDYIIQWVYRDTEETDVTSRYEFNRILNFNTYNKAFFPYTVTQAGYPTVNGIIYVTSPGGTGAPDPVFKYITTHLTATSTWELTFSDEHDSSYIDWAVFPPGRSYTSYFVTGYKLRGQAIKKFQPQYIQVWSNVDTDPSGYKIQGIWDYSINRNSGRWSSLQSINLEGTSNFKLLHRRHKIRGSGYALQFKVTSQDGKAFDIAGWAVVDTTNQGT